jgi:hypothetical protein
MSMTVGNASIMGKEKLSEYAKSNPWAIIDGGIIEPGRYSNASAAQRYADRYYRGRNVEVRHTRTGRGIHRRRGSWFSDAKLMSAEHLKGERRRRVIDA